jgi:hypothetical protein
MTPHEKLTQKEMIKIVATAAVFDLIEMPFNFIPIIGWVIVAGIDVIAWITLYFMFRRYGVKFNTTERFLYFNSGLILDLVPFINTFAWTLDVVLVIGSVKRDERMAHTSNDTAEV